MLAFLVLCAFAAPGSEWIGWTFVASILVVLMIVDAMFFSSPADFAFDPNVRGACPCLGRAACTSLPSKHLLPPPHLTHTPTTPHPHSACSSKTMLGINSALRARVRMPLRTGAVGKHTRFIFASNALVSLAPSLSPSSRGRGQTDPAWGPSTVYCGKTHAIFVCQQLVSLALSLSLCLLPPCLPPFPHVGVARPSWGPLKWCAAASVAVATAALAAAAAAPACSAWLPQSLWIQLHSSQKKSRCRVMA